MEDIANDKNIKSLYKKALSIWNIEILLSNFSLQFAGVLINGFVISVYLVDILKASPAFIGLISGIAMFQGVLQPFAALAVRKLRKRKLFTVTALLISRLIYIGSLIYGYFASLNGNIIFPLIAFLCFCATIVQSLSLELNSWIVDLTNKENRASKLVFRTMLTNVGAMVGILLAGIALRYLGSERAFPIIFIISIIVFIVAAITLLNVYDPPRRSKMDASIKDIFNPIIKDNNYLKFLSVVAISNFGVYSTMPFFNTFYLEYLKIPYDMLGFINTLSVLVIAFGSLTWGYIIPIVGGRLLAKVNILLLAIIPIFWIIMPVERSIATSLPLILLYSFAQSGWMMAQFHVAYNIGADEHSTAYISMYFAVVALCAFIAPNIGGLLVEFYSSGHFFIPNLKFKSQFMITFILSFIINMICIVVYPAYRINKERSNLRLRDILLRTDSISVLYKLTLSNLIPSFISNKKRFASEMGHSKTVIALPKLISMLDDIDQNVRLEAIDAMGEIPDEEASDILIEFSERANILELQAIVRALGNFYDERSIQFLKKMYTSKFLVLRMSAANALYKHINDEIKDIAIWYISTKKYNEDDFMGHLIILATNKAYESIGYILAHYKKMKNLRHKEEVLYYFSMMFDVEKSYYKSYNDDKIKSSRKNLNKLLETIFEIEEVKRDKNKKIQIDTLFKKILMSVSLEENISFFNEGSIVLNLVSEKIEKEKQFALKYFINKKTLEYHELNFLSISINHILKSEINKNRKK